VIHGDVEVPASGELVEVVARNVRVEREASGDLTGCHPILFTCKEVNVAPGRVAKCGSDGRDDRGE
jgi:hypothetical protein